MNNGRKSLDFLEIYSPEIRLQTTGLATIFESRARSKMKKVYEIRNSIGVVLFQRMFDY